VSTAIVTLDMVAPIMFLLLIQRCAKRAQVVLVCALFGSLFFAFCLTGIAVYISAPDEVSFWVGGIYGVAGAGWGWALLLPVLILWRLIDRKSSNRFFRWN
jgi:hypothetical protein